MKLKINFLVVIFIILSSFLFINASFAQSANSYKFEDGDVICFLGDSITYGGQFHEFLQLFYVTRYPFLELTFLNSGISGDNAADMIYRFEEDVLVSNPTHIFLMTGMNDVQRTLYTREIVSQEIIQRREFVLQEFKKNFKLLAELIKESEITPILLTPSIYDQYSDLKTENNLGCNDALIEGSNYISELARQNNYKVVDINQKMMDVMLNGLKDNPSFTVIGKDRVHPETTGNFIMFYEIISSLEIQNDISKLSLDITKDYSVVSENSKIENLSINENNISFDYQQNSLPFPINPGLKEAMSIVPFQEKFNKEIIQIIGLENGTYNLFINNYLIDTFSDSDFELGINISNNNKTPQYNQAKELQELCRDYRKTGFMLRSVPFIEFKYLRDLENEKTLENKKTHLSNKLNSLKDKPYYNYIKNSIDDYFKTYPIQDSLRNRLFEIKTEIYKKNKPKNLNWSVIKN